MLTHVNRERCDECGAFVQSRQITQCPMCASYVCGRCDDGDVCIQCRAQHRRERMHAVAAPEARGLDTLDVA